MRTRFLIRAAGLAIALVLPLGVAAQRTRIYREGGFWVEEAQGSLASAPQISVRLPMGSITIRGVDHAPITYQLKKRVPGEEAFARRQFERFRFHASRSATGAVMKGEFSGGHFPYAAELLVQVPRSVRLVKIFTHNGNESVTGIHGRVEAVTAGGNVFLDNIAGSAFATSAGGNVEVGDIGGDLTLKTGGGNVQIRSVKGSITGFSGGGNIVIGSAQSVRAHTSGGQIEVRQCAGELTANTEGGSLDLGQIAGKALLRSAGGSIRLSAANGAVVANTGGGTVELFGLMHGANVQTGTGSITAEFLGPGFRESSLQTPSGDITVYLAPHLRTTVRATVELANGHRIGSDFSEIVVSEEEGQLGSRSLYAEGNLNGGGPVLRVRAINGNIEFRRARK